MSNLEELIEKLCPDGVEYKSLIDLCDVLYGFPCDASKFNDDMIGLPLVRIRDVLEGKSDTYTIESVPEEYKIHSGDLLVGMDGNFHVGIWKDIEAILCQRVCRISSKDNDVLLDGFLNHLIGPIMKKIELGKQSGTVKHLLAKDIKAIKLPVPPLEVQREIVRILDNFTLLTAELAAELAARQKQYEYYKVNLLLENNQSPNVTLNDIAINRDSQRKPVTSSKRESGNIPYYGASGIVDYVKDYIFDGDYLLVSEDGANLLARNTPIAFSIQGKTWVNNHAHILEFDNYYTRRYVEFYLNSIDLTPYISGGAQPKLNQKNLNSIKIPLPVLQEQQRIVGVLDRFDALCNDISSGLPAEIEARQKQYEYYRDKLLSFKELKKEA